MPRLRFSVKRAVAIYLSEDESEIDDKRRYQPSRTPCPVFTVGNDYLTASKTKRPPKGDRNYNWVLLYTILPYGWTIWKHEETTDE